MERQIDRKLTLSGDEVKAAVWHYLKTQLDQPVPESPDGLTMIGADPAIGKLQVTWTEHAILEPRD